VICTETAALDDVIDDQPTSGTARRRGAIDRRTAVVIAL
jgi:hypothetical protein